MKKKIGLGDLLLLEISVVVYSLSTVAGNLAGHNAFMSKGYIKFFGLEFVILAIYSGLWQQVIKRFELSIAYCNKSVTLLWSMLWNFLIFSQGITPGKVVGVLLVMGGVIVMNLGGSHGKDAESGEKAAVAVEQAAVADGQSTVAESKTVRYEGPEDVNESGAEDSAKSQEMGGGSDV